VVQDSYYKDIRIDLPGITVDLLQMRQWTLARSYVFPLRTTMAGINRGTRKYRTNFSATEQVLIFTRKEWTRGSYEN
jgi:hypothetical protein